MDTRAQEVGSLLDEGKEMRVDVSTTHVRSVIASARTLRFSWRRAQKEEHDGAVCQTRQTLSQTRVVCANVCCVIKRRSRVPRFD